MRAVSSLLVEAAAPAIAPPRRRDAWRRLLRNRLSALGLGLVAFFSVVAAAGPHLIPYSPVAQDLERTLRPPGATHLLGTDEFGRDVLSRAVYGARLTLGIGMAVISASFLIGFLAGVGAAVRGGVTDEVIMRVMDVLLALPGMLLAIVVVAALGPGTASLILAMTVYNIPQFARMSRATALGIVHQSYLEAAGALGASPARILFRHVVPNCLGPVLVFAMIRFSLTLLTAASLSFLGLGIQPPTPEFGAMLHASRAYLWEAPHLMLVYGGAVSLMVLGFNAMAEGFRDVLDPASG